MAPVRAVAHLRQARSIILVGAVLQILGEGALGDRRLYPLALASPLILVVGILRMRSAYAEWLPNPPAPSGAAAVSPWHTTIASFPAPPPPRS
jgi:hypothetical protein